MGGFKLDRGSDEVNSSVLTGHILNIALAGRKRGWLQVIGAPPFVFTKQVKARFKSRDFAEKNENK
jgi:hypothetical protein